MGPEELKTRKAELEQSHVEWTQAGLMPNPEGGSAASSYQMMRYLDAYRGDYPNALDGGVEDADQMVGNITFSIINTMVSTISGKLPDPLFAPMGGNAAGGDARRRAWLNEQVVRTYAVQKKYKEEVDLAVLCAVLTGGGFVRHGYTPEVEWKDENGKLLPRFKNQHPDFPWIQMIRPWDIRIDPMVNSFSPDSEPRWVAFRNLWADYQIRNNPNLKFRNDLKPTFHRDLRPERERSGTHGRVLSNNNQMLSLYEEWMVYDFEEQKCFGISPGCDKLIREEAPWPFNWGQLPYSYLAFNPQLDTPFPIPYMKLFYKEQMMYNRLWTIINAFILRTRRLVIYNKDKFKDEEGNLVNPHSIAEFIACEGPPADAIKEFGFGQIDGQTVGLLYQLKEQIREVLGVSSMDMGQRVNVQTADESAKIGVGSQNARGRNQEKVEAFWENIYAVSHRSFTQSQDSRRIVIPIIGQQNLEFLDQGDRERGFFETEIGDLEGEFQISVRLGSTIKVDPAQELAAVITGFNSLGGVQSQLLNQRHYHERIVELTGEDPRQAVLDEKTAQNMGKQAGPGGEEGGKPNPATAAAQQGLPDITMIRGGR